MAMTAVKIEAYPESPEISLEELKQKISASLLEAGAVKINAIEEEPLAFGLNSLVITVSWPEQLETDLALAATQVEGISSVKLIDYRRAFG